VAERALEFARQEAEKLEQELVEAPHILLGVLGEKDGAVPRLLKEVGADRSQFVRKTRTMLARGNWTPGFYRQRRVIDQSTLGSSANLLESLGRDLTEAAALRELNPIVGRDEQVIALIGALCGMRKPNALLVGRPGVGKTAIVEGLAQWIVKGTVPEELRGVHIRTIEIGSLIAGTAYRGQFEQRLADLIGELIGRTDVILFVDDAHLLIGAGASGPGSVAAANMLQPVLSEGKLRVIGATTPDDFGKYFERDTDFVRRFQPIRVEEPSAGHARDILESLKAKYEAFHHVKILDESLEAAVNLSVRYVQDRCLPDKALDLLDGACTQKRLVASMSDWMPKFASDSPDLVVRAIDIAGVIANELGIPVEALSWTSSSKPTGK
jgi:ATP-dependent Clp protease ATP-binding subunit ClpC